MGEVGTDEFARDGKDQTGLNQGRRLQGRVVEEIRKRQSRNGVLKWGDWLLHSIAGKIDPLEEVGDLVSTNTKRDLKHLGIRHFSTRAAEEPRAPRPRLPSDKAPNCA